jgi:release factor glutamine methyltransferase
VPVATASGPAGTAPEGRPTGTRSDLVAEVAGVVGSVQEARWIVEHAEHADGAGGNGPDGGAVRDRAAALARRRAAGEPLQYVLGTWAFRTLELDVDPRVLIPRPETEQVVEVALAELDRMAAGRGTDRAAGGRREPLVCVDLGTGSGAIALSLAAEGPAEGVGLEVWATDASPDALAVARTNLARLGERDPGAAGRVTFAGGSWFEALPARLARTVDLVVANPPYVSEDEFAGLEAVVREWEPYQALVAPRGRSGVPGLADVEAVVAGAVRWLRPTGALVVELAPHQVYAAIDAARRAGFLRVGSARDLTGRMRMLVASR